MCWSLPPPIFMFLYSLVRYIPVTSEHTHHWFLPANYPKVLHEVTSAATAAMATAEYHATATTAAPQEHPPTSLILLCRDLMAETTLSSPLDGIVLHLHFKTCSEDCRKTLSQKPTTKTNLREPFCVLLTVQTCRDLLMWRRLSQ